MKILLDTCTFLWIAGESKELTPASLRLFCDPANDVYLSSVSVWEIVIKQRLGKLPLPSSPREFVVGNREAHEIDPLPLDEESVLHLARLPQLHRDPFDRMLVCQAIAHGLTILTPDELVAQYPVRTAW